MDMSKSTVNFFLTFMSMSFKLFNHLSGMTVELIQAYIEAWELAFTKNSVAFFLVLTI